MNLAEKTVQNAILRTFATRSDLRLWRANVGKAAYGRGAKKRVVQFGVPGQADLSGLIPVVQVLECPHCQGQLSTPPLGVRLEIEVKRPADSEQQLNQEQYQRMIERFGGIYILARSAKDVWNRIGGYLQ